MHQQHDLLELVVAALEARKGDLQSVARATGVPYDTVLRIKNRENDPGYSKVAALAAYLLPRETGATDPTPPDTPLSKFAEPARAA